MAPSPGPPQTQAIEHIEPQTRATEHIGPQNRAIATVRSEIGLEIAWLASSPSPLSLESSPRCAAVAPPLRPQGILVLYFSLLFSISLSHLNLTSLALLIVVL